MIKKIAIKIFIYNFQQIFVVLWYCFIHLGLSVFLLKIVLWYCGIALFISLLGFLGNLIKILISLENIVKFILCKVTTKLFGFVVFLGIS